MINSSPTPEQSTFEKLMAGFDKVITRTYTPHGTMQETTYEIRYAQATENTTWQIERGSLELPTDPERYDRWSLSLRVSDNEGKYHGPSLTIYGAEVDHWTRLDDEKVAPITPAYVNCSTASDKSLEITRSWGSLVIFAAALAQAQTDAMRDRLEEYAAKLHEEYVIEREARRVEREKRVQVADLIDAGLPNGEARVTLRDRKVPLVGGIARKGATTFILDVAHLREQPVVNMDDIVKVEMKVNGRYKDAVLVTELIERELA